MIKNLGMLFSLPLILLLSSCGDKQPVLNRIDQVNLCEVNAWGHDFVSQKCKPGQKVVYLPQTFGNEQLPIIFAAINCDLRYTVTHTVGGVACIYAPITPVEQK
jgi:hypothetical protein